MSDFVERILASMSIEQKIGQCVVIGMSGTRITNDLREAIVRYHAGGLRLSPFARIFRYFSDDKAAQKSGAASYKPSLEKIAGEGLPPYATPQDYAATLNELRALAAARSPAIPLHMVIDQEGDTSKDLSRGGVVQFPSNLGLAAAGDTDLTYRVSRAIGKQLKASGLDMIHSPVVDVNINPDNPEIGRRAFGDDPELVAEQAIAMMKGFQDEGIIAAAKHFPGRGDSATDAHHACPLLDVSRARLDAVELLPYRRLIAAGLDSVMVAHCIYPALDTEIATVSRRIVHDLLREELGFQGLITSDSMTMGALIDKFGVGESCARALAAGIDVVLMKAENQWRGETFQTIREWVENGKIPLSELDDKVRRVLRMKEKYGLFEKMGMVDAAQAGRPYTDTVILETAREAARRATILLKDDLKAVPLNHAKKILLINQRNDIKSPNDRHDHPALFQDLMEEELPGLQCYETSFGFDPKEEERILAYVKDKGYEIIVCTNWYDRSNKPQTYAKALIDAGYPVLLLTNDPYCAKGLGGALPTAPTLLLSMNLSPQGLHMIRDILFGRETAQGRWPLVNYDPFGLVTKAARS
ncbi:MAG: glycoside hydrolase family 3 protein [Spirochaetes bacterium]|nr:glycoside hydrolase family 3 protein [Spirochaetota bacterium]MBU0956336.1 glycoside hydrolase family 3 protein [Spirochaetota bacterium]